MARPFNPMGLMPVEAEMLKEKAFGLRRLASVLEEQLAELRAIEAELPKLQGAERAARLARHQDLWKQAEHQRWKMIVHREAMGLAHHEDVDRYYPRPRRITE